MTEKTNSFLAPINNGMENITDNMHDDGYEGIWYSYVEDMKSYRVQYLDGVYKVFTQDMQEIKDEETQVILDRLNHG